MKFRSGPYEVFENGCVIGGGDGPIQMIFDRENGPFTYRIIFKNDYNNFNIRAEFKKTAPDMMDLYFYNFNGIFDTGSPVPVKLGSFWGRPLFLAYRIDAMANVPDKIFHYTWFLGDSKK